MKLNRNVLITAVLVSIVLSVLVLSPLQFPFKIPKVKAQSSEGWVNRYAYQIDYGNGTYTTKTSIGPQVFWDNETSEWQELSLVNNTDKPIPHYLIRNSHITAKIGLYEGEDAVLYYDPDMTRKVCAERWNVQGFQGGEWVTGTKTFYNHTVTQTFDEINVTGIFKVWFGTVHVGWLRVRYVLRAASFLKHEVVYKSIISETKQYRCVMTLIGMAGKQLVHSEGTVLLNETEIESKWNRLTFVNASNPQFQFLSEKLDSLGHYVLNETSGDETWVNDYLRFVRLKLVEYWGKQLVRCDIIIGNYTLGENESLLIDPDSDTWQVAAGNDDAYEFGAGYFDTTSNRVIVHANTVTTGYDYACGGLRFISVGIPQGSSISAGSLTIYTDPSYYNMKADIYGNNVDNAQDFNDNAHIISTADRPRTNNYVTWIENLGGSVWEEKTGFQEVIQEITDRNNWASGNAIVLLLIAHVTDDAHCRFISFDSSSNFCAKLEVTWTSGGDTTAPTYSNVGTNTTIAGDPCKFYTKFTDNVNMSGYIFGTNNTGTATNDTWTAWSPVGTPKWANITKTLNTTVGIVVQWWIYANDTSDNWNNTGTQSLTTIFSCSITVDTTTHGWSLNPGDNNITITEDTINLTTTANAAYDIQVKGNGNLTCGSNIILLSNVLVENDTLADAIALSTSYQDVPGLTNLPSGTNVELTFILWLSCPSPQPIGDYTYTLTVKIKEHT